MITNFPLLQQRPGSNRCLSTAVRVVLLWSGEQVTADEVSEWCAEDTYGRVLDLAIGGLRDAGFDVQELTAPTEEEAQELLRASVMDEEEPHPVIVTLRNQLSPARLDHAVVLVGVEQIFTLTGERETVTFMDPVTGRLEQDTTGTFWRQWEFAGRRAYIIQP